MSIRRGTQAVTRVFRGTREVVKAYRGTRAVYEKAAAKTLSSIAVTCLPEVVHYAVGDAVNYAGLVVTATYSDSSTANVTTDCAVSPSNGATLSTVGPQTVTVSYTEKAVTRIAQFVVSAAGASTATRLYLTLPDAATKTLVFQPDTDGAVIDWGDGSAPESVASSSGNATHAYAIAGGYVVSISGTIKYLGTLAILNILNQQIGSKGSTSPELTAVEFGDVETVCPSCFNNCTSLTSVYVPKTVYNLDTLVFTNTTSLTTAELDPVYLYGAVFGTEALEKVWLHKDVLIPEIAPGGGTVRPFENCSSDLILYCEPVSRPAGWSEHFDEYDANGSKLTVVWGQTTRPW